MEKEVLERVKSLYYGAIWQESQGDRYYAKAREMKRKAQELLKTLQVEPDIEIKEPDIDIEETTVEYKGQNHSAIMLDYGKSDRHDFALIYMDEHWIAIHVQAPRIHGMACGTGPLHAAEIMGSRLRVLSVTDLDSHAYCYGRMKNDRI